MNKATIYINGVIGQDTNLLDVIRQYKSYDNPEVVEVLINSVGGCVDTGMSIFNYLRNLQLPVTTIATQAYSIAASIFMAGDNRVVESGDNRIMIHFPWASVDGGANHLEMVAKELRTIENEFITFYSTYTNIDSDSIKSLLQNETFLGAKEALEIGIATEIKQPLKAVAIYTNNNKEDENEMTNKNKFMAALVKAVDSIFGVQALSIQDANAEEINFKDLEEGVEPQVGDKAVDAEGKPIDGERVLASGETMVFTAGELTEIKPAETEEVEEVAAEAEEVAVETEEEVEETEEEVEDAPAEEEEIDEELLEELLKKIEEQLFAKLSESFKKENSRQGALNRGAILRLMFSPSVPPAVRSWRVLVTYMYELICKVFKKFP